MTAYSLAVQADVRKRMSLPNRQHVPQISKELGIRRSTLYHLRSNWRLRGEVMPVSEKDPDSWSAADKFTVVLETAGFNATDSVATAVNGAYLQNRYTAGAKQRLPSLGQRAGGT